MADAGDAQLANAFAEHSAAALETAYAAYGATLYAVARSILRDVQDAEDCVHDALVRVWQRRDPYRPARGSLRPFLIACVRNEAVSRVRRQARHTRLEKRAASDAEPTYELEVRDPVEHRQLREALATLPEEQRRVLALAYAGHLSQSQIAERLELPLGTIKSRVALGLRKLARHMQPETP